MDDEKEMCGLCGKELDQDGACDCAGARETREGDVLREF